MAESYDDFKAKRAKISRERSEKGREIGPLPKVKNARRRKKCEKDFRAFCETYLKKEFAIPWSEDHLTLIERMQATALAGGTLAMAMPRGSGKTTMCMALALWCVLYGHRRFVMLVGASEPAAVELIDDAKSQVETNDVLADDFPEVCVPVRALEGMNNRANGQTLNGERTRIQWTEKQLRLPTIPGKASSGAVFRVAGITGRIRGAKSAVAGGGSIRPDFVVIDDPQDDQSAASLTENTKREKVVKKAVLGLAGPKKKIAAVMPCTVIVPGDLADRMLDRGRNPVWQGERFRLMYAMPTNTALWDRYAEIRRDSLRRGGTGAEATEFYRENRAAMDEGAIPAWPERYNPDELSAVQFAMNIFFDVPHAFAAEYQNDPLPEDPAAAANALDATAVASRVTRLGRWVVPRECTRVTAFCDVSEKVIWYVVAAWDEKFGGSVIDYGCWPKQNRSYFAQDDARPSLATEFPGVAAEAAVFAGLRAAVGEVCGRMYPRDGGGDALRVDRCLADSGDLTDVVHQCLRQSPHAAILTASKGFGIRASGRPLSEWPLKTGERPGWHWILGPNEGGRGRLLKFGANEWKTFVAERLRTPEGAAGCLQLFGEKPHEHELFADHCAAEYPIETEGRGRRLLEWKKRPGRAGNENHLWDCLVGAAVAASVQGLAFTASGGPVPLAMPRPTVRLSDVQARKREGAAANTGSPGSAPRVRLSDLQRGRKAGV